MNFLVNHATIQGLLQGIHNRHELWDKILRANNIRTIAEIGVWRGNFAKHLLKNHPYIQHYYMIDPWANLPDWNKPCNVGAHLFEDVYAEAIENTAFASEKIKILRGRTKSVIGQIQDGTLDFAYIDGDHTLRGITIDLIKILPKIRDNGLIGGDDFSRSPWQHGQRFEPTLVCPLAVYFAEAMNLPIAALPFNQFLIQKSKTGFKFIDSTGTYNDLSLNKLSRSPVKVGRQLVAKSKSILRLMKTKTRTP